VSKLSTLIMFFATIPVMNKVMETLKKLGLSEKEAKIYVAALENGESTVTYLSQQSGLKRTTMYDFLKELVEEGFLYKVQVGKRILYGATSPRQLIMLRRRAIERVEDELEHLEARQYSAFDIPKVKFFRGENGFKNIWDQILESTEKEYRIVTNGVMFSEYITENYLFDEIIEKKMKKCLRSKQLITPSKYATRITKRDEQENRVTRFLPADTVLEFTEIVSDSMVAYISESEHNSQFIIQSKVFAHYRKQMFEALWDSINKISN